MHAGEGLKQAQAGCSLPPAPSVHHEYSSMDVTLEVVPDMAAAIDHIHANGSGHTGACCGSCQVHFQGADSLGRVGPWAEVGIQLGSIAHMMAAHVLQDCPHAYERVPELCVCYCCYYYCRDHCDGRCSSC